MPKSFQNKRSCYPAMRAALELWAESGRRGIIKISGDSMSPLLCDNSKVVIEFSTRRIKLGDIVVYRRDNNLIIHRIVKVKGRICDRLFQTKGDNTLNFDPLLIRESEIIGKVIGLVKGETIVDLESGWWRMVGNLLTLYSNFVGQVINTIQFWVELFFKEDKTGLFSFGGRTLLSVFSILPRVAFELLQLKFRPHGFHR